jgi:gamma-glutamylputrescine oxidase
MLLQNWWTTTLLDEAYLPITPLTSDRACDVLIVGGGMAGISAAAALMGKGLRVVLLERAILGGSTTGRSAGFLTPDSELELAQLIRRFGTDDAREIWDVPCKGIDLITGNVRRHGLSCDLLHQDSLFLGLGKDGNDALAEEVASRRTLGFPTTRYDAAQLPSVLGATGFAGGVRYTDTYGINAQRYCQCMKRVLRDGGVEVFEASGVIRLDGHVAATHLATVKAEQIIVCIDKMPRDLDPVAETIFHAQTFLAISEPLGDRAVARLFPSGDMLQCWDSSLVYSYFRLTGDQRLLLGGGSLFTTYWPTYFNAAGIIASVIARFKQRVPDLADLNFIQYWPGLIDTTRDLLPVIKRKQDIEHVHLVSGAVGLPWAAFCGDFAARAAIGEADADEQKYYAYFTDRRHYLLPRMTDRLMTKPAEFAVNNWWAKYHQVDVGRKTSPKAGEF